MTKGIARALDSPGKDPLAREQDIGELAEEDLDKALAGFIIANGAAAMGSKVTMFFTFWGLNILRKPEKVGAAKNLVERMFGWMMPRGPDRLKLSKMHMGGLGAWMIKRIMRKYDIIAK